VLSQRIDDRQQTAERRLDVYLEQTTPVIDYYRQQGVLLEVDGDQPIEEVQRDVLAMVTTPLRPYPAGPGMSPRGTRSGARWRYVPRRHLTGMLNAYDDSSP
jgi:hypothetical protein